MIFKIITTNINNNNNDDNNNSNNNNNSPVAYKYWAGVQRGIAVSHVQEELFSLG